MLSETETRRWEGVCLVHCHERRYLVVALADWRGALAMIAAGEADVIVVARSDHLPAIDVVAGSGRGSYRPQLTADVVDEGLWVGPATQRRPQRPQPVRRDR